MRAIVFDGSSLAPADVPDPEAGAGEVLIEVAACGVCRTDLHIVDGELSKPKLPLILGHQIVGRVAGDGRRVGVPWLGWSAGTCRPRARGRENLGGGHMPLLHERPREPVRPRAVHGL